MTPNCRLGIHRPAGARRGDRGLLGQDPHALAQALTERQVPVVWNDLIRELERIRRRKNQLPLSASWYRNVGIALELSFRIG